MTKDFNNRQNNPKQKSLPKMTKEEYREKKQIEREEVYRMVDEAAEKIVEDPNSFIQYLDTQSRLDKYSAVNALLISSQCPQASQLKSFYDWSDDNVRINKGEKSISMLEPVEYAKRDGTPGVTYAVKKVFDISQTDAKRSPAPSANKDPKALFKTMLESSPVNIDMDYDLAIPDAVAYYDNDKQTIFIKREVGDSVALAQSLAQELAHAQLSIDSERYSRRDMGFQAVCIGYMLCKKYGIDTRAFSIGSIPENFKNMEPVEIRKELSKMRNAMSSVHTRVSDVLNKSKQERNKAYER